MRIDEFAAGRSLMGSRVMALILTLASVFTATVVVAGVGLVAFVGQRGNNETWRRWSDVGQAFGLVNSVIAAVAVAVLIATSLAQSRGQRAQQAEISLRQLHVTVIRMAIDNPHLAAVWPRTSSEDPGTQAQHMYVNLLLQLAWSKYTTGIATREEMISNLRFLFASPVVRNYWRETTSSRNSLYIEGTLEASLAQLADEIWREYEAVLSCSGGRTAQSPTDLPTASADSAPIGSVDPMTATGDLLPPQAESPE